MQALIEQKPREDAADPRDLSAIAYAESHMGDYKLKSSPNYEVQKLELWLDRARPSG
jgi:predicted nucleotidyltransferase